MPHLNRSHDTDVDWNDDTFYQSEGRWLFNEAKELAARSVKFNMTELVRVAMTSQGHDITSCIGVQKLPGGSFNKAFLMTIRNGRQVIAKIPNPNAGLPFYTTASEVATMDFSREIAGLPVPKVYAWSADRGDNPVGAEYIIMDKAKGVPLSTKWPGMNKREKIQLIENIVSLEKGLSKHPFESIGSIYYQSDLAKMSEANYALPGQSNFVVGPITSPIFQKNGRKDVVKDRGPWRTAHEFILASARRERECILRLPPIRRPYGIFGGPGCYKPSTKAKLEVLDSFEKVAQYLLPKDSSVHAPVLWHGDLHSENIFVDAEYPAKITSIIDWQSLSVAPLFHQAGIPCLLECNGPTPAEGCNMPSLPEDFETLDAAEKEQARKLQFQQTMYKTYEMLCARENRPVYNALLHSRTLGSEIITLISQVYNDGEPYIKGLLIYAAQEWDRVAGPNGPPCPLMELLTPASIAKQEFDLQKWGEGLQLLGDVIEALGGAEDGWDGWAPHEDYEQISKKLQIVKDQFLDYHAGKDPSARNRWASVWPFQDD